MVKFQSPRDLPCPCALKHYQSLGVCKIYYSHFIFKVMYQSKKSNIKWTLYKKQQHKPNQKFPLRFVRRASWDYGTVVMHEATHFKIGKFLHYTFIKFHYIPFFFAEIVNLYFIEIKRAVIRHKLNVKSISFSLGKTKIDRLYPNKLLSSKGSLISESFSFWLKSPKKRCQITKLSIYWSGSWFSSLVLRFEPKRKTSWD